LAADLGQPFRPTVPRLHSGEAVIANWVMIPPGPGSGGATTLFRIIRYLQHHGYVNRIFLYDVYSSDLHYYQHVIRDAYGFSGPVESIAAGMEDAHALVATSWPSAYPVFNSRCAGKRFYFVQDFEPYFYPVGTLGLLAENTYRMGFHAISIGGRFQSKLVEGFGMQMDAFQFGCDTSRYHRLQDERRTGIAFYARPEAPRRGTELGLMALEVLAKRQPGLEIHLYGSKMGRLPFRSIDHGRIAPQELNLIYNRCFAGLSLSLTNVSLVPQEMLAAGCIPVVNDTVENRTDLSNPFVRYATASPHALAAELEAVALAPDFDSTSRAAAASVRPGSWDEAGAEVDKILRRSLEASSEPRSPRKAFPSLLVSSS
jgi:hypothetical protein